MPKLTSAPYLVNRTVGFPAPDRRRTSIKLEPGVWDAFDEIRRREGLSIGKLVAIIDAGRGDKPIGNATREYVLAYFRRQADQLQTSDSNRRDLWAALYAIYAFVEENGPVGTLPSIETVGPEPSEIGEKIIAAIGRLLEHVR